MLHTSATQRPILLVVVFALLLISPAPAHTNEGAAQPASIGQTHADGAMRIAQQRSAANQHIEQQQRAAIQVSGPAPAPAPASAAPEAASPAAPGAAPVAGPTAAPAQALSGEVLGKKKAKGSTEPAFPGLVGTVGRPTTPPTSAAVFPGSQQRVRW